MKELSEEDVKNLNSKKGFEFLLSDEKTNFSKALKLTNYFKTLKKFQKELIILHEKIIEKKKRVIVIFESRDAGGKVGIIRRITENINPRHFRIVALPKPPEEEKSQWYFQRYVKKFPNAGEIVFFNRSWYNRAVVEPVNKFCTKKEYEFFMKDVNDFERMITSSGILLIKVYMSISKMTQARRFKKIKKNPLKQWKIGPVNEKAQELWNEYTKYKKIMFEKTDNSYAPWKIIDANKKIPARINAIKYILSQIA